MVVRIHLRVCMVIVVDCRPLRMKLSKKDVVQKYHIPEEAIELAIKVEDSLMEDGVPSGLAARTAHARTRAGARADGNATPHSRMRILADVSAYSRIALQRACGGLGCCGGSLLVAIPFGLSFRFCLLVFLF